MKTLKLIVFGLTLFIAGSMQGQISVNVNFGTPPQWGPVGYSEARYYYLPDVEAYYDIQSSRFIYFSGNRWVHRTYLPSRYRNYDLYNGYKVVMTDYRGQQPYRYYKHHRSKYAKGYRGHEQRNIGVRPSRGNSHVVQRPNNHPNNNVGRGSERNNSHDNGKRENDNRGNDKRGNDNHNGHDKGRK